MAPGTNYRWPSRTPALGSQPPLIYQVLVGQGVLRSTVRLVNTGASAVTVESVTSFLGGGLAGPGGDLEDVELLWAENDWAAEARWQRRPLRDALPDVNRVAHHEPVAGTVRLDKSRQLVVRHVPSDGGARQPEDWPHLGMADRAQRGLALAAGRAHRPGPGRLLPRAARPHRRGAPVARLSRTRREFRNGPGRGRRERRGFEEAVARLTRYRRAIRRPHEDHRRLPVIFNDYMNTLMGDPTTDRLVPLVSAAARAGRRVLLYRCGLVRGAGRGVVGHGRRMVAFC